MTIPGPFTFTDNLFGPSTSIDTETPFKLRMMSVTSSLTPANEENSCKTPSICTETIEAPCNEDNNILLRALPKVSPNPLSRGSVTIVALLFGSSPGLMETLDGLINSCQFLWIISSSIPVKNLIQKFFTPEGLNYNNFKKV